MNLTPANKVPLISERKFSIFRHPFVYGYADNFLPAETYARLQEQFPVPDAFNKLEELRYGKRYHRIGMHDPLDQLDGICNDWRHLIETVRSARFVRDCGSWARNLVNPARAPLERSLLLGLLGDRPSIREWSVQLNCEFSMLARDSSLPPHTDSIEKILSFLLYFPSRHWQTEWGGGTQIYAPINKKFNANWSNSRLPRSQVESVFDSGFVANRLFFFVKSANSWHGIAPLACPRGILRNSFNFHLAIPEEFRKGFSYGIKEQIIRSIELPRFRKFVAPG